MRFRSLARVRVIPPSTRFSSMVRSSKMSRPSGTWAMPRGTTRWAGRPVMSLPWNAIVPFTGLVTPQIACMVELFPRPVRPDEGDDLSLVHPERDPLNGPHLAVGDMEIADFQHGGGHDGQAAASRRPR